VRVRLVTAYGRDVDCCHDDDSSDASDARARPRGGILYLSDSM
jgi:hypothetical protein